MRILKPAFFFFLMTVALVASAEVQVIDGKRVECKDGVCVLVEDNPVSSVPAPYSLTSTPSSPRIAQGYMSAEEFVAFLENREVKPLGDAGLWMTLLLVLLGGLAMNLTPCVLPMIPINLMIIGRSAWRGTAYGLGMAVAYGFLGIGAAVGGLAFGDIQGNPWFNVAVALIFAGLALALFGVFFIDLSRFRPTQNLKTSKPQNLFFPFFMGALSAVLAGACVAPVLISVLLLTGKLYAEGHVLALGLPFIMGFGMALPWPFLGTGLQVLPKPGPWMRWVNRVFGVIVLFFALWYGRIAWRGFHPVSTAEGVPRTHEATAGTLSSTLYFLVSKQANPILVDCWASWCKNCSAMDRVMKEEPVKKALEPYTVIRVQAEELSDLRRVKGFESIRGLPAFVVFD